jgi:RNA polymerase sigma-70 factor (ECF subfamily)
MTTDDAFAGFCALVRPSLVGALALHCGDRGVAEELAQEALARTWERWTKVRRMPNPFAWTYRVAFNLATSWFRRRAAETRARQRDQPVAQTLPDHAQAIAVRAATRRFHRGGEPPWCCATTSICRWPTRPRS